MANKRRSRKPKKFLILLASGGFLLLLLFALFVFTLSSPQLKRRVLGVLSEKLCSNCTASVGKVYYRFPNRFIVEDLTLSNPPKYHSPRLLKIERLEAVANLRSLLTGKLKFRKVEANNAGLSLEVSGDGKWNLLSALKVKEPSAKWPDRIAVRNLSVRFNPGCFAELLNRGQESIPEGALEGTFNGEIKLRNTHLQLSGNLNHGLFDEITITGSMDPAAKEGNFKAAAHRIDLQHELLGLLPPRNSKQLERYKPSGEADLTLSVSFRPSTEPKVEVKGKVYNFHSELPFVPYTLRHANGGFSFDGSKVRVQGLRGNLAEGQVDFSGLLTVSSGAEGPSWQAKVKVERFPLDERLGTQLPEEVRKLWDNLSPHGEIGADLTVSREGGEITQEGTVTFRGVDMAWSELPYAAYALTGTVSLSGNRFRISSPLTGVHGTTTVTVAGSGQMQKNGALDLLIKLKNLRLDQELKSCLKSKARSVWDDYEVGGLADAKVEIKRQEGEQKPKAAITLEGKDASIRYRRFPYPIEHITGKLVIEKGRVEALNLSGYHGQTVIKCPKGWWKAAEDQTTGKEHQFIFKFKSPELPIDEDLVRALPEDHQKIVNAFQLEGEVAAEVTVERLKQNNGASNGGKLETNLHVDAEILDGRMEYRRLPYPLHLTSGKVFITPHTVVLNNVSAENGDLKVYCKSGSIADEPKERTFHFSLAVDSLRPEPELIEALPAPIARFLTALSVEGAFHSPEILVHYSRSKEEAGRYMLGYQVVNLNTNDASMDLGMNFRHIKGNSSIIGVARNDCPHHASGTINMERVRFHRIRLRDVVLKCSYGERDPVFDQLEKGEVLPGLPALTEKEKKAFLKRVPNDKEAKNAFQVRIKKARAYGGKVRGLLVAGTGKDKDLTTKVTVEDMDLKKASSDLFKKGQAAGTARAEAFFRGHMEDINTFRGYGEANVKHAKFVRLPLFAAMFENLIQLQSVKKSYFHRVHTSFKIKNGAFHGKKRNSILMKSDIMTLQGFGKMDFDLNLNMYFSLPSFGLPRIPLISGLLQRILDNLAAFHVTGNLDKPKVEYIPLQDLYKLLGG